MAANDRQVGGDHYSKHKVQPWDIAIDYELDFLEGLMLKYLLRKKGNRYEDLQKMLHVLEKKLETMRTVVEEMPKETIGIADIMSKDEWDKYKRVCEDKYTLKRSPKQVEDRPNFMYGNIFTNADAV